MRPAGGLPCLWTVTGNWQSCRSRFLWRSHWPLSWKEFGRFIRIWSGIFPSLWLSRCLRMRICCARCWSIWSRMPAKPGRRLWMCVGIRSCGSAITVRLFRQMSSGRFLFRSLQPKRMVRVSACHFPGRWWFGKAGTFVWLNGLCPVSRWRLLCLSLKNRSVVININGNRR